MWFLYDNVAALCVAAVCSTLAWLYGGIVASALFPSIPWLLAIMAEISLCFPQRRPGETTFEARERVWAALKKDPAAWIAAIFLILLLVPFFNKGPCPCCDYPAIHFDGVPADPPVPYFPFCVDRVEHLNVVTWFFCAFTCALAARHALLKRGKRLVMRLAVWNGVALAALGMVQYATGAESPLWSDGWKCTAYFFSTFGYPNMGGDYFTTLFALAVALWRRNLDEIAAERASPDGGAAEASHALFWRKHLMLVPAAVLFFAAMMTLSRSSILLGTGLALIFFAHAFASFVSHMRRSGRVKAVAANLIALVLIGTLFAVFISGRDMLAENGTATFRGDFAKELSTIDGRGIVDRIAGKGQYHNRVAARVWKEHFLFGCGGWGYKHFCIPAMTDAEFKAIQNIGGINVHNDFLQFMAEHGIVGLLLIVSFLLALVLPVFKQWKELALAARFMKKKERPPRPAALFVLPAGAFCALCALAATVLHSFADCPLRSPAVLTLFFTTAASIDGFIPRFRKPDLRDK